MRAYEAINEQLREGERLRRRIEGANDEDSSSDSESDGDGDAQNESLLREAQSVLAEIDGDAAQTHRGVFQ